MTPSEEEFWANQHKLTGNNSILWQMCAEDLIMAMNGGISAVQKMLAGYAIECLLKALWLEGGNQLVDNNNK